MVKEMIMNAFMYNIFTARIRGLPREAGRGEGPLGRSPGVMQQSNSSDNLKG